MIVSCLHSKDNNILRMEITNQSCNLINKLQKKYIHISDKYEISVRSDAFNVGIEDLSSHVCRLIKLLHIEVFICTKTWTYLTGTAEAVFHHCNSSGICFAIYCKKKIIIALNCGKVSKFDVKGKCLNEQTIETSTYYIKL